ncbi:sugar O-acetyltransferase [Rhodotorula paludigena]|uniref:sugar O-acetyltransferase n=1 Tax=Rhodotorula paludigena TaxID=86838 RepID=UPI003181296D
MFEQFETVPIKPENQATADELAALDALSVRERASKGYAFQGDHDDEMTADRFKARQLQHHHPWPEYKPGYNVLDQFGPDSRRQILCDLFRISQDDAKKLAIEPPFYVDYGYNIKFKGLFYANVNCVFLDGADITFGDRVVLAPGVHIYCTTHSTDVEERRGWYDRAYPVTIGDDVWIGGGAEILPGTVIGNGCTVAAGSVVKGVFPDNCVIGGVPARILKRLEPPQGVIDPKDKRLMRPVVKTEQTKA